MVERNHTQSTGILLAWYLLFYGQFRPPYRGFVMGVCILVVLVPGGLILADTLTRRLCISDQGISVVSVVNQPSVPFLRWGNLVRIDVQKEPASASGIGRITVRGRHNVPGLGGGDW